MPLFRGVPRKRRKAVPGAFVAACAVCGVHACSLDMVWFSNTAPGGGRIRALVHPECNDEPQPPTFRPRRHRTPYLAQPGSTTNVNPTIVITVTAAVFATTGTTSATVAQATADPTITLTGTGFTDPGTKGVIDAGKVNPKVRSTTFSSATSISFELDANDIYARTLSVGAIRFPDSSGGRFAARNTYSLTVT